MNPATSSRYAVRILRLLLAVLLFGLLASCSTVRLGYSNGDTLLYWWLDGYVDFRSAQKSKVKSDISSLLNWHRSTQLPQYAQVLAQLQNRLAGNPGPAEVDAAMKQIEQMSQVVLLRAVPELTDLALSLDEAQLTYLARKFDKNNEEFRKKHMSEAPDKQAKIRFKKVMKEANDWFGSFSREQEDKIRQYADKRPQNYQFWMDERIARQKKILQLLAQLQRDHPSSEVAQGMVRQAILASYERPAQPERRAQFEAWNDTTAEMIVAIIRDATPEQKIHAHKKLQGWIEDCHYFMAGK